MTDFSAYHDAEVEGCLLQRLRDGTSWTFAWARLHRVGETLQKAGEKDALAVTHVTASPMDST